MSQENSNGTVDLTKDLEYQPSGIVSRILLKQPTGSVTAFAFDEGQELSEHTCPYDALLQVLDGRGDDRRQEPSPGIPADSAAARPRAARRQSTTAVQDVVGHAAGIARVIQ